MSCTDENPDEEMDYDDGYRTYFMDCTCEHSREQHGWRHCEVEGCPCEGGFEE